MASMVMHPTQQYQALHGARTLAAARVERELQVVAGRLWLTGGDAGRQDVVLERGDRYRVPPGQVVVIEAWPRASFALCEPVAVPAPAPLWRRWFTAVRHAPAAWRPASVPQPCRGG